MKQARYDGGSWQVEYAEQDKTFTFEVTDYHAGSLRMTLDQLTRLTGDAGPVAAAMPAASGREPVFGISRKEKNLYIAIPEGWSGLLKISRKELYQIGKKMGRRGQRILTFKT